MYLAACMCVCGPRRDLTNVCDCVCVSLCVCVWKKGGGKVLFLARFHDHHEDPKIVGSDFEPLQLTLAHKVGHGDFSSRRSSFTLALSPQSRNYRVIKTFSYQTSQSAFRGIRGVTCMIWCLVANNACFRAFATSEV